MIFAACPRVTGKHVRKYGRLAASQISGCPVHGSITVASQS